ncbi:uncharacterized protein [Rutidosis leptorrhynchoides]|uniref:uncharacterized protein n=1 Tax=Rutidosis leptorrhynchoides TaxID=125765 RepID=UPI003A9915D4
MAMSNCRASSRIMKLRNRDNRESNCNSSKCKSCRKAGKRKVRKLDVEKGGFVSSRSIDSEEIRSINSAWLLCGDFNEVRECSDGLTSQFHQSRADQFNDSISRNNLIEVPICGRKFTRISDDGLKFSKLDRFLVTDNFMSLWEDLSIIILDRNLSDHCLLVLRDRAFDYGLKPFKVFDEWFNSKDIGEHFHKQFLRHSGSRPRLLGPDQVGSQVAGQQPSQPYKFGPVRPDTNLGVHENEAAFNEGAAAGAVPSQNYSCFRLTETEARDLEVIFLEEEIWGTIKDCANNKTPRPDGFNILFYKKFWAIILEDLVEAINGFWSLMMYPIVYTHKRHNDRIKLPSEALRTIVL